MIMNASKKKILLGIAVLSIGAIIFFGFQDDEVSRPSVPDVNETPQVNTAISPEKKVSSDELISITFDVLRALNSYHLASVDTSLGGDDLVAIMTELMNDSRHLRSGNSFVEKYTNHQNEIAKLTAQGMILGSQGVIKANNSLLEFLRSLDQQSGSISEVEYQMATFLSSQREGYGLITISAPQITGLMFEPAKSDNPTGAIPYTISKEQRNRLLREIERLFGEDLRKEKIDAQKTGQHNAILFAVQGIQTNLLPDNYEDIAE
jgi:hypothetical protein